METNLKDPFIKEPQLKDPDPLESNSEDENWVDYPTFPEQEVEILPDENFISLVQNLSSMDDFIACYQLNQFTRSVIANEDPQIAYSHFTPTLFRSLFEQVNTRVPPLISEVLSQLQFIYEWNHGIELLYEADFLIFFAELFKRRECSNNIIVAISLLISLLRSDLDPELQASIISTIYELNLPQILLQLYFKPKELIDIPTQIIDLNVSEVITNSGTFSSDSESDMNSNDQILEEPKKKRTTLERIIKIIKEFITELLYFDLPPFITDFSSVFPSELFFTCLPKYQEENIQNTPFRLGSADYGLVKILAKFYTQEFVQLIVDPENLIAFIQIAKEYPTEKDKNLQVKADALDALGYLYQVNPHAVQLCIDSGLYDLIQITYIHYNDGEISPDGLIYLTHILDCCDSIDINLDFSPFLHLYAKNTPFQTKKEIYTLFSKYFKKTNPAVLEMLLKDEEFLTSYLDWFFDESNDVLAQVMPGFAFLISFAKENNLTDVLAQSIDEENMEQFDEIVEAFQGSPLEPSISIIHDFIYSIEC